MLFTLVLASVVSAQDQRSVIYEYDAAGNLVSLRQATNSGPPTVSSVEPPLVRVGDALQIQINGSNLFVADVTADELQVFEITHLSSESLLVQIQVPQLSPGEKSLFLTTPLGSATAIVTVADSLPIISTNPSPILIANSETRSVSLLLDRAYETDVLVDLVVVDDAVAIFPSGNTNSTLSLSLLAGQTELTFDVQGVSEGNTELQISQIDNGQATTVSVVVAAEASLPLGTNYAVSRTVGVNLDPIGRTPTRIDSKAVGVRRTILVSAGESITSAPVGVNK